MSLFLHGFLHSGWRPYLHVFIFLWLAFWYLRQPDSDVDTLLLNLLHCSFQPCISNIAPGSGNITDDVDLDPSLAHSCQLALVLTLAGFGLQKGCGQTIPSNRAVKANSGCMLLIAVATRSYVILCNSRYSRDIFLWNLSNLSPYFSHPGWLWEPVGSAVWSAGAPEAAMSAYICFARVVFSDAAT